MSRVVMDLRTSVFVFFFFSSRRRHTRLQGDWSSDVCSSDLLTAEERARDPARRVHPLLDVDGEREEVEVVLRLLGSRRGRQHHGLVVEIHDGGTAGQASKPAGLEPDLVYAERAVVDDDFGGSCTLHG